MSRGALCVGVIGASRASEQGRRQAHEVGRLIAEKDGVLVCGGLGGIMESAAHGCSEAQGTVVGILPGDSVHDANPYVTIPIVTNMGHARNVIIAQTAQVLIAIEGEYGTLSEIAVSLKLGKRVFALGGWQDIPGVTAVASPQDAVDQAFSAAGGRHG